MGMRSTVQCCELHADNLKLFISNIMAEKIGCNPKDKYMWDSIKFEDNEITVDWDDWKIQSYWYKPFCAFCVKLREYGLRGTVYLVFCYGEPYTINFTRKIVHVKIEKKEGTETFIITSEGIEFDNT